jgi:hypothetical protein
VRYRVIAPPFFVHCCHCRWCQRETGSAFVLNALVDADRVEFLNGRPEIIDTPSESGRGQRIHRCPSCQVAVFSNYAGMGDAIHFVRVGTLDDPDRRAAGRPRFGLGEMPQDRVDHVVLGDERDDLHLRAAGRAHQRVDFVDPLDQLCPASPDGTGVADLVTSRTGGRAGARTHNLPILSLSFPALAPRHVAPTRPTNLQRLPVISAWPIGSPFRQAVGHEALLPASSEYHP